LGFEDFARALDDLWDRPEHWQALGRAGQEYVRKHYGCRQAFLARVVAAVRGLAVPLAERMRARGLERAAQFDRAAWREQFAAVVEDLLDAGPRPYRAAVEVRPRSAARTAAAGSGTVLVPVRVVNRGSHAVLPHGPGRVVLRCRVVDDSGQDCTAAGADTSLPALLMPGRALAAAVPVPVPAAPGTYRVAFRAERPAEAEDNGRQESAGQPAPESWLTLTVEGDGGAKGAGCCGPLLEEVQAALVEANRCQRLPDDYTDVTEGVLAAWKRRIKRKLLGNFKHAYVDVLSRQQSAFNRSVLAALHELAECCATLDHASAAGPRAAPEAGPTAAAVRELADRLAESQQRCAILEERLARLEAQLNGKAPAGPGLCERREER
jgi:hypothetical protein